MTGSYKQALVALSLGFEGAVSRLAYALDKLAHAEP